MDTDKPGFFNRRVMLGLLAGAAVAVLFISLLRNYVLAAVLGTLLAGALAGMVRPRQFALLGLIVGAAAGAYLGARSSLAAQAGQPDTARTGLDWVLPTLGGMVIIGLISALYGLITGKLLIRYRQGQGPFT